MNCYWNVSYAVFIGHNKTFISIITEFSVCYSVEYSFRVNDQNIAYK